MARRKNKRSEAQQVANRTRAMHAYSFFMNLAMTAKQQISLIDWQRLGGLEAEETLDAWQHGRPNSFFDDYAARKATAGHPGPSIRVQHFRRLAVLLSAALQRTNMKKGEAREQAARALTGPALLGKPSARMIESWELEQPELSEQDQQAISEALVRCGADRGALVRYFLGAIRLPWFAQLPWGG
jgi:hypothetical protein